MWRTIAGVRFLIAFASLVLTVSLGASRAAANDSPPDGSFSDVMKGKFAGASWSSCTPIEDPAACLYRSTSLAVFEGKQDSSSQDDPFKGTWVCLNLETSSDGYVTYEYEHGCATVSKSEFMAADLSSATLHPTSVTLYHYRCAQECEFVGSRDVTVEATWTAMGSVYEAANHYKFRSGNCVDTYKISSDSRAAVITATLNGVSLGDSDYADLAKTMSRFEHDCRW